MSEASNQVPVTPASPPPPSAPGPEASPYEWRAYRRELRHHSRRQRYGSYTASGWGLFFAAGLIVVGVYYLLRSSGLLPWFPDSVFWPLVLIAWGLMLLVRIGTGTRRA